jgi:glycerol-3-phosphate acyltransferase PlsY
VDVALILVIAYLFGSIPSAHLISRLKGIDIRKVGDGNIGSFNVFRHVGFTAGILTLVADTGKGALVIVLARILTTEQWLILLAGAVVVSGHIWTVFLNFKGGRGVATIVGVFLVLLPKEMPISFFLAVIVAFTTYNSIWIGVALFVSLPLLCYIFGEPLYLILYSIALPCIAGLAHWLTTRKLSREARVESRTFRIARH